GKIKAGRLDFEDVYYVKELKHYNLFSLSQMCDKKNKVLLTDIDCLVMSPDFKLPDENQKGKQHKASLENQANKSAGPQEANNSAGGKIEKNEKPDSQVEQVFLEELEKLKRQEKEANDALRKEATRDSSDANTNSTNLLNVVSAPISTVGPFRALNDVEPSYPDDPLMPHLEDIYASPSEGIFTDSSYDDEGVVTDFNNLETTMNVSPTPITRIHTINPKT
nr:putative ribonuclease H-like domain-containing protein [Tanacetum cinerariifolium]